jgi:hypothetical protein
LYKSASTQNHLNYAPLLLRDNTAHGLSITPDTIKIF